MVLTKAREFSWGGPGRVFLVLTISCFAKTTSWTSCEDHPFELRPPKHCSEEVFQHCSKEVFQHCSNVVFRAFKRSFLKLGPPRMSSKRSSRASGGL